MKDLFAFIHYDPFGFVPGIYPVCLKQPCSVYRGAGALFPDLDWLYRGCLCFYYQGAYVSGTGTRQFKS